MKKKSFSLKAKAAICVLLFSFLLLPISTNISSAAEKAAPVKGDAAKVAQAEVGAAGAAAGAATTGAAAGLYTTPWVLIVVGGLAAAVVVGAAIGNDDNVVAPTVHHP